MAKKGLGLLLAVGPKKGPEDDPFETDDLDDEDDAPKGLGALGDDHDDDEIDLGDAAIDPKLKASYEALCDATEDRDYGAMDRAFDDILDRKMAGR